MSEKFDEILLPIIEEEERELRSNFTNRERGMFARPHQSLDEYFKSVYDSYKQDNAVFDEAHDAPATEAEQQGTMNTYEVSRRLESKVAYASVFGMKAMFNLCAAQDIKEAVDKRFENDPDNELRQQVKDYVDQKLAFEGNSDAEKKLVGEIKNQFDKYMKADGTTKGFLDKGYAFFDDMNNIAGNSMHLDAFMKLGVSGVDENDSLENALLAAHADYARSLQNTVICNLNYRMNSRVDPKAFLESHRKGKYSEADRDFVDDMFVELERSVRDNSMVLHTEDTYKWRLSSSAFNIDGEQAESREDTIAALISGKKVQFPVPWTDQVMDIQPVFFLPEKTRSDDNDKSILTKISEFFDELWEGLKDMLGVSDKVRTNELNEQLGGSGSRHKISFSELADNRFADKLVTPENREKIKNKQLEINTPAK